MKTLAILSPNENVYSETFIQAHKKLPFIIKYYYGGFLPARLEGKGEIFNGSLWKKVKRRFTNLTLVEQSFSDSLATNKPDCILAEYGPTAAASLKVIKQLNIPLVVHFHGYDATANWAITQYRKKYVDVFGYANAVIAVSKKMKQDLVNLGCPGEKIFLNYYGPNDLFFNVTSSLNSLNFVSIGRFVDKKAPYLTIAAFKNVVEKFSSAELTMIGEGSLLNTCKNLARLWNLEKNIVFRGAQSTPEILESFKSCRAFVQHSITADDGDSEGTPVAILEAMAAGIPVISTVHAGIPDVVINGETGLLVKEKDVKGMADNMIRMAEDIGLAKKLGEAGRKRVRENFTMDVHLNNLKQVVENACR